MLGGVNLHLSNIKNKKWYRLGGGECRFTTGGIYPPPLGEM